ncbi:MAG: hypothetical protein U1E23_09380 [Reyranellaceae bacterium]
MTAAATKPTRDAAHFLRIATLYENDAFRPGIEWALGRIPPGWFISHFSDDGPRGQIYCKLSNRHHAEDVDSVGAPTRAAAIAAAALRAMAREVGR